MAKKWRPPGVRGKQGLELCEMAVGLSELDACPEVLLPAVAPPWNHFTFKHAPRPGDWLADGSPGVADRGGQAFSQYKAVIDGLSKFFPRAGEVDRGSYFHTKPSELRGRVYICGIGDLTGSGYDGTLKLKQLAQFVSAYFMLPCDIMEISGDDQGLFSCEPRHVLPREGGEGGEGEDGAATEPLPTVEEGKMDNWTDAKIGEDNVEVTMKAEEGELKEEQPTAKQGKEEALQDSADESPTSAKLPPEVAVGTAKPAAGRMELKTGSARARPVVIGQRRSSAPACKAGEGSGRSTHSAHSEPTRRTACRASTSAPTKQAPVRRHASSARSTRASSRSHGLRWGGLAETSNDAKVQQGYALEPEKSYEISAAACFRYLQTLRPKEAFCIIAVTPHEIYIGDEFLNVGSQFDIKKGVAVISTAGCEIDQEGNPAPEEVTAARELKLLTRELGHLLHLNNCIFFECAMNGACDMSELDRNPLKLCPVCLHKVHYSARQGWDPAARLKKLKTVYGTLGLAREAAEAGEQLEQLTRRRLAIESREVTAGNTEGLDNVNAKIEELAVLIRNSRSTVVITGPGIAAGATIPSWSKQAEVKGEKSTGDTSKLMAIPTVTHMAVTELHAHNQVQFVVSENADGLHRRSGLPAEALAELDGNLFLEYCEGCGTSVLRPVQCTGHYNSDGCCKTCAPRHKFTCHCTGHTCAECGGMLRNGMRYPQEEVMEDALQAARKACKSADLGIVLGSTLQDNLTCELVGEVLGMGAPVVLATSKPCYTQMEKQDLIRIVLPLDELMFRVMARLQLPIPAFVPDSWTAMALNRGRCASTSTLMRLPPLSVPASAKAPIKPPWADAPHPVDVASTFPPAHYANKRKKGRPTVQRTHRHRGIPHTQGYDPGHRAFTPHTDQAIQQLPVQRMQHIINMLPRGIASSFQIQGLRGPPLSRGLTLTPIPPPKRSDKTSTGINVRPAVGANLQEDEIPSKANVEEATDPEAVVVAHDTVLDIVKGALESDQGTHEISSIAMKKERKDIGVTFKVDGDTEEDIAAQGVPV